MAHKVFWDMTLRRWVFPGISERRTVQFQYPETCGGEAVGKDEDKGMRWYEAGTFTAREVSEKHQSQIRLPLEDLDIPVAYNVSDKCFCRDSGRKLTQTRQPHKHPIQPTFFTP
jgi:hypothetical protein